MIHPDDQPRTVESIQKLKDYQGDPVLFRWIRRDGRVIWTEQTTVPIFDENDRLIAIEGIVRDVTDRKQAEEKLNFLSSHDVLTGLFNRSYFDEVLNQAEKTCDGPVTIVMIDLDELKPINDTFGHAAGDDLLVRPAQVLHSIFRSDDIIARVGGDEFAVLLPNFPTEQTLELRERMQAALAAANKGNKNLPLSFSFGIASGEQGTPLIRVLNQADAEMYEMKREVKKGKSG